MGKNGQIFSSKVFFRGICLIASYVKEVLKNHVIDTVWFVVSFDNSLNEVTQKPEIGIWV